MRALCCAEREVVAAADLMPVLSPLCQRGRHAAGQAGTTQTKEGQPNVDLPSGRTPDTPGSDRDLVHGRVFDRKPRPDANHRVVGGGHSQRRPHDHRVGHLGANSIAVPDAIVDPSADCSAHANANPNRRDLRR
jgi:hypothetical protein